INSIALALRNEVREYNIRVSVVMPGDSSTGFTDAREKQHESSSFATAKTSEADAAVATAETSVPDTATNTAATTNSAYPRCDAAVASMERDERGGIPPAKVAAVIVKAARKKNPAPLYVAGFKYRILLGLYNLLPARAAVWLVGKFY
ncbi:MAG: hypothetical protein J6Y20_12955, partial [Lachnospiraceae bacterium]|nr:hypothetical protein [Lachnospiraceae bacterium]